MRINLSYEPRPHFLPFHNRASRWAALVCHRRAGKTVAVINDLIIGAVECKYEAPQLAYIAPNYQQAKRIAWEYLKKYAAPIMYQAHESELRVTLQGGAKIFLLGAEKADNLRGMYLDGAALDEFAQIKPSAVSQVILPCLSDRQGWLVYMGTPMGKNHFYDIFKAAQEDPLWYSLMLKASQSGIVPKEELDIIRRQMDPNDYLQEYECSFEAALRGAIYGNEMEAADNEGRIGRFELDPALPIDVICDLGFADDTALGFFQVRKDGILIHETIIDNERDWDSYLDEMDQREVRDVWLPHDARARTLQTGRSIVEQTIRRGYRPKIVPDHKLRDGIAATRKMLPFTYWNKALTGGCVEAMKSYRRLWDDKLGCYRENPVHDWASHPADMVRYLGVICSNLPTPKPRILLPEGYVHQHARNVNYGFSLEDLWATAPRLEQ